MSTAVVYSLLEPALRTQLSSLTPSPSASFKHLRSLHVERILRFFYLPRLLADLPELQDLELQVDAAADALVDIKPEANGGNLVTLSSPTLLQLSLLLDSEDNDCEVW